MNKLNKLKERFSGKSDTVDNFMKILSIDENVLAKFKYTRSEEIKTNKTEFGQSIEIGDEVFMIMLMEEEKKSNLNNDEVRGLDLVIRLSSINKNEFNKIMLSPQYVQQIVKLDANALTYSIDKSNITNPAVVLKMSPHEIKQNPHFKWFEHVVKKYKLKN